MLLQEQRIRNIQHITSRGLNFCFQVTNLLHRSNNGICFNLFTYLNFWPFMHIYPSSEISQDILQPHKKSQDQKQSQHYHYNI